MLQLVLIVCLTSIIKGEQFENDLQRNIKIYRQVYFDFNIRDFPQESIKKIRRRSAELVRVKISDALLIDENSFDNERDKRDLGKQGPLNMKISDALQIDENSFDNEREKRDLGKRGPLNMKISDALLIGENSFDNEREKRDLGKRGPLNMKISDALLIDENSFDNGRDKRGDGPKVLRMHISDASSSVLSPYSLNNEKERSSLELEAIRKSKPFKNYEDLNKDIYSETTGMCKNNNLSLQQEWFEVSQNLRTVVKTENAAYFENWGNMVQIFPKDRVSRLLFQQAFPKLKTRTALEAIGSTDIFQKLFWPFVLKAGVMNQRLGLFGLTGENVPVPVQKTVFYTTVEKLQTIKIPVAEGKVIYSFDNNVDLIDGMNRSGLLENSKDFIDAERHLFNEGEQEEIRRKVDEAMKLIQENNQELYTAINQLVACFAFYKSENRAHIGGTVTSALGIIWLDPSALSDWSVPFYAEQIVHEFIHTSLFYAELVHGTFTDHRNLSKAKVTSSIRRQHRDYDKSFHAAYVSTGLVAFHSRACYLDRAEALVTPLISSVDELVEVNKRTGILTESGKAMLQTLIDFIIVTRLGG